MEKIKEVWNKQVHWLDEDYTIGGIVLTFVGLIGFIILCGITK